MEPLLLVHGLAFSHVTSSVCKGGWDVRARCVHRKTRKGLVVGEQALPCSWSLQPSSWRRKAALSGVPGFTGLVCAPLSVGTVTLHHASPRFSSPRLLNLEISMIGALS